MLRLALVALVLSGCWAAVAERRGDGSFVVGYLAQGAEEMVTARRDDAMATAKEACGGKRFVIEKEWDASQGAGWRSVQNQRNLLIRCIDPKAIEAAFYARVLVETGCEEPSVESKVRVGSVMVYRVDACGTRIVCEVRAADVQCKRALAGDED